jgi:hypothetical protein
MRIAPGFPGDKVYDPYVFIPGKRGAFPGGTHGQNPLMPFVDLKGDFFSRLS